MTSKVDKCLEILNLCSLDEKKELLEILKVLTHDNHILPTRSLCLSALTTLDIVETVFHI